MADFSLANLIAKFNNTRPVVKNNPPPPSNQQFSTAAGSTAAAASGSSSYTAAQMNALEGSERSLFVKDIMKLPKQLNELIYMIQKNISQAQLQQQFGQANRNALSNTQAQILAQLQGLSEAQNIMMTGNKALASQLQSSIKNLPLSASGMINLSDMAALIQANGKDAVTKLISSMANAAKAGINDLTPLRDSAKIINASVAAASQNDSAQTMKMLLLLYLPWLPLQEGTDFDLEFQAQEEEHDDDSILVISITTINYGTLTATLILENSNSVTIIIQCSNEFPKDELLLRIEEDKQNYAMHSNVSFETKENAAVHEKVRVNMSNTNLVNPYMLLTAHTIIRHTIEIDKTHIKN
ncbi:MAG: hypothetical protein LBK53_01405 [Heliobacteriaceae bacterium]|jgi:hypothetical protein|nr:hypothetical protein [Heliobacteriaceae bacterium]